MKTPEPSTTPPENLNGATGRDARATLPIERAIRARIAAGQKALVPFLTAGYPDMATFVELLRIVEQSGCDCVEVGLPFSDPIADGPTIQFSNHESLLAGTTLPTTLAAVASAGVKLPMIAMGYFNPILAYSPARFVEDARQAGFRGVIVPDVPLDDFPPEGEHEPDSLPAAVVALSTGWERILLAAPTTTALRLKRLAKATRGFLYAVTIAGVTGARSDLATETIEFLQRAKAACRRPVLAGFGISNPETARRVAAHCDGVIVGSALINCIRNGDKPGAVGRVAKFLRELRTALG